MTIDFAFPPDAARAQRLDHRMRTQLADSLDYLRQALREQAGEDAAALERIGADMRQGRQYPPSTFGLYYELASALIDGDAGQASALLDELAQEQPLLSDETDVLTLDQVSPPSNLQRYQRLMDTDPRMPFRILPPPAENAARSVAQFRAALARLRQAVPALAGEFEALVRQVILVRGDTLNGYQFDGGSSYMLWGGLFINAERHDTDIAIMEAMAHESAHSLLFGYTIDETLVENPDDELYPSPLRYDPRPMDGIYHATYVSARMHWAMSALLDSGQLRPEEIETAREARDADCRNFFSGYQTVAQHARLTATGRRLMQSAYDYMQPFSGQ